LAAAYLLAALFVVLIGSSIGNKAALMLTVFGAGFCVSGGQVGANALTAAYYPTSSRATGVGWASGIGRIGSVVGAVAGGWMLGLGLGLPIVFAVVGVPALIACFGLLAMGKGHRAQATISEGAPTRAR
jgi:AAHS family 4-hydroxybenzoate transporter-like MFS transporter